MRVCPKCRASYADDSKLEYCVCGAKIPTIPSLEDMFSGPGLEAFKDIFNKKG